MQIIKTEKLSLDFNEQEILNRTVGMMEDIMHQSEDTDLVNYASDIYDAIVEMLDRYEE